ncbi:hypothetical protein SPOG_01119 [Schizosaccharomyces cryophilus OY26]|uniref:Uncharacterized protein n=1 Tax=Schizosaccharomyces cryophilus (strain OY26 / ATCC MYA-4695 / CBS 11777 / NBRC 106824 / NRRL Y48691) TaxID=653667 RepID=S9VWP5_SCHCR|nr:uncharacterized protein SPOG_01119 [Schizosaccharomyces cryophilus OY26]EPY50360.1 hypothetical protein SPOG_01119 [Schizosaccharomyces cryophilus OY26]
MSQPEETFEKTAPIASEIPLNPELTSSSSLWQQLQSKKSTLKILSWIFVILYSIYFFILFFIYLCNYLSSAYAKYGETASDKFLHPAMNMIAKRKTIERIASYFTFIPCLILGLFCLILLSIYFRSLVVKVEGNLIPLEDFSRKGDDKKEN